MIKKVGMWMVVSIFFCLAFCARAVEYRDVPPDKWYYNDIMLATNEGFLEGNGVDEFNPESNLKVSEAITIMSKLHSRINGTSISLNSEGEWYVPYLSYAMANGIIEENRFQNLEQYITRLDLANICYNVLKDRNIVINDVKAIPDVNISDKCYEKLKTLYNLGIIVGVDEFGNFNPNGYITRAQVAAVTNRVIHSEKRLKKEFKTPESVRYATFKNNVQNEANVSGKIFVSCENWSVPQEDMDKLQAEINKFGGLCGFYLVTLDGNFRIGYNIDKRIPSASTVKAPFSLYSMKQIEAGNGTLDEKCVYEKKHYCGKSGIIQNSKFGTSYSLSEILYYTINISDNVGYYMLQDRFGISGYNNFLNEIGCSRMKLEGGLRWGYIYPRETALIWNEIYNYSQTSEYGKKLFDLFVNAKFNFIKQAYLTKYGKLNYEIAHKSGFNANGRHDGAIVLLKDVPYFITITTKPVANGSEKTFLNNTALILEGIMQKYVAR